jgi:hypothetical protein
MQRRSSSEYTQVSPRQTGFDLTHEATGHQVDANVQTRRQEKHQTPKHKNYSDKNLKPGRYAHESFDRNNFSSGNIWEDPQKGHAVNNFPRPGFQVQVESVDCELVSCTKYYASRC